MGGEPDPRHLQKMAVAASFRTWPGSPLHNAGRPAAARILTATRSSKRQSLLWAQHGIPP